MRRIKIIVLVISIIVFLIFVTLFLIGYFSPKGAGLTLNSDPISSVYINGQLVGKTPFEITRNSGEIVVKLVPDNAELSTNVFETKVKLVPGIKTIINHDFGVSETFSQGEIMSFEKVGGGAALAIITIPDGAQITMDGKLVGFSPKKIDSVSPEQHQIVVSSEGYLTRTFTVRTYDKYKLTAVVQLAKLTKENIVESPTPAPSPKSLTVKILETPNGFLRVRKDPSVGSPEVARLKPGELYPLIDATSVPGWYKIESGWVSSDYAQKIEE